jgi:TolB-like protein/Tfp pilus assembly protein PilF
MSERVAIGPFLLDPGGHLTRDGVAVPLGGRALAVLSVLASVEGTVTKDHLLDAAWPGVTVEEGNLTVQIAALRRLLGEEAIVTVPRVGYRLRRAPLAGAPVHGPPRLAVLPFEIIGGGPEDTYFADGLAEDLIAALGRFRQFIVVSRRAAVAAEADLPAIGVGYRLDGSLRRAGGRLRIAARLSDVITGAHLWAKAFDGGDEDVFAFQAHIAGAVAAAVAPGIEAAEIAAVRTRAANATAYDIGLRALAEIHSETESGNRRAEALLTRALAIEPDNGMNLALSAWVIEHRTTMGWSPFGPDDRARAVDYARRTLMHAQGDPRALTHAGMALVQVGREYDLGMAVLDRALEENPLNALVVLSVGVATVHCGDLARAEALMHRALALSPGDPLRHIPFCGLAHIAVLRQEFQAALAWATRSLAVNPSFDASLWMLIAAHTRLGNPLEAAAMLVRLMDMNPAVTVASIRSGQPSRLPERIEPILEALKAAGLPEGPSAS